MLSSSWTSLLPKGCAFTKQGPRKGKKRLTHQTWERSRGWETCSCPQLVTSIWAQVLLQAAPLKVCPGTSVGVPLSWSLYRNCSSSRSLHRGQGALIPVLTSCLFNCLSPSLPHPTSNTLDSSVARPLTLWVPLPCSKCPLNRG